MLYALTATFIHLLSLPFTPKLRQGRIMATFRKRGKSWRAEMMRDGQRYSATFQTKSEAIQWAANFKPKADIGKTLGDALALFRDTVSPTRKGARWEIVRLNAILSDPIAQKPLSGLVPADFAEWRDRRLQSVKGASVNRDMALLGAVFRVAVAEWQWLEASPLKGVRKPQGSPARDRRVTDAEISAIVEASGYSGGKPTEKRHFAALAFCFAIETAMRAGEILSLSRDSIDVVARVARLEKTKNGTARDVPLSSRALQILETVGYRFPLSSQTLDVLFRRLRDQAGIVGLTFHDSRHEAITRLAGKLEVLELARMVGHKNLNQLLTYYNKSAADIAKRLD